MNETSFDGAGFLVSACFVLCGQKDTLISFQWKSSHWERPSLYWNGVQYMPRRITLFCVLFWLRFHLVLPKSSRVTSLAPGKHDDVIKWKHFPCYWPFVRGIHRWPVNSSHKRPVTRNFDAFFDLRLNKWLSQQSWGWWFETPSRSLLCHRNDLGFLRCQGSNLEACG